MFLANWAILFLNHEEHEGSGGCFHPGFQVGQRTYKWFPPVGRPSTELGKGIRSILLNRFERDRGVGEGKTFLKSFSFPHLKSLPFSYARARAYL